ncbi:hypothetical protein NSU08_33735 [Paenibacillus sp. FSL H7-0331]|uniref:hypothetical protein n=1 Tax=Paenibacillus sp. FSL H7-0331 TaxID=1920421 RepID=UPI00211659AF|nr:hypothetical protein [Paenibacillus sp. FSL H7-0331]
MDNRVFNQGLENQFGNLVRTNTVFARHKDLQAMPETELLKGAVFFDKMHFLLKRGHIRMIQDIAQQQREINNRLLQQLPLADLVKRNKSIQHYPLKDL